MSADGEAASIRFGGFQIDTARHCLIDSAGAEVSLRRQSFNVLQVLAEQHDTVVSKETLFERVWPDVQVTDDSLTQCVADIRRALGEQGHQVLRTVPRRGYMLVAEAAPVPTVAEDDAPTVAVSPGVTGKSLMPTWAWAVGALIIAIAVVIATNPPSGVATPSVAETEDRQGETTETTEAIEAKPDSPSLLVANRYAPTISIERVHTANGTVNDSVKPDNEQAALVEAFVTELRAALLRYKTVRLVNETAPDADYKLVVGARPGEGKQARLTVEAIDIASDAVFLSRSADLPVDAATNWELLRAHAVRIASFASPAGGALSKHLMASAFHKPVERLTRAECYAHAYDCTSCAGRVETLSARTKACLASLLKDDPNDPAAWALKASLHAINTAGAQRWMNPSVRIFRRGLI